MLSKEQSRDLELIKKSFNRTKIYESEWLDYERIYRSEHTPEFLKIAKEQERNAVFIPLTYSTINIADSVFSSAFFSQGNPIELLRIGDNDSEKRDALQVVVDHFYNQSKPYHELSKSFLSASIYGVGALKIVWDDEKEEPDTTMIPPTELGFDIDAISIKDNKYTAYKFQQTLDDINSKFEEEFYSCEDYDRQTLLEEYTNSPFKRKTVKEIFTKRKKGYEVRTFIDDICVREAKFKRMPIKFGHLLNKLPSIDLAKRNEEIAAIGDSLVRIIKPLNEELNIKRNQRMDLIEKHIDPDIYVPEGCGLDPVDAMKNGGIKSCDTTAGILFAPIVGASEFTNDVAMLKNDIEDASSVNGIMRGVTSASDRRSSTALATVNANSSIRLESMIKLINETLFEHWAKEFVRLCYINASDELVMRLTEKDYNPLGDFGFREELDFDITINFGISINKQAKIQDLMGVIEMVKDNPNADINTLVAEIVKLTLGENVNVERILGVSKEQGDGTSDELIGREVSEQNSAAAINEPGSEPNSRRDESAQIFAELDKIRNNEI